MKIHSLDGTELFYLKDIPENKKAIIIIVHGLGEHCGRYDYLTNKLNSHGYGVYRFDNRGHGKSGGERGHVNSYKQFISDTDVVVNLALKENPNLPLFMVGHSMGGFIAAVYGIKYGSKLKGQILSGAATNKFPISLMLQSLDLVCMLRGKVPNSLAQFVSRNPEVVKAYENDPLILKETTLKFNTEFATKGVGWLSKNLSSYDCPCLILHGGDDKIVPKFFSENFYDSISSTDKELKIYDNFYHEIFNEDEKDEVIKDVFNWLDKRIK